MMSAVARAWPDPLPIVPIAHPLQAAVRVPGSKSLTNRALVVAALADGITVLDNALLSDDSHRCMESLARLGFAVEARPPAVSVAGRGGLIPAGSAELYVGNAGTAARFLTALVTLGHGEYVVDGDARMRERPIEDLVAALRQLGVDAAGTAGCPPVRVRARGLPGGRAAVSGEISSQFLSGLLMAAPAAQAPVTLEVAGRLNSRPYVDLTLAVMADFGVTVERDGYARFHVRPQCYQARGVYAIESDASAASYFFAAPAICGGVVRVAGLSRRSRQGDLAFLDVLARMGCQVTDGPDWIEVGRDPAAPLQGVDVDLSDLPDTAQTLAAVAPFAAGPTTIRGIASARVKETDRVAAACAELARLGVPVTEHADGMTIAPARELRPAIVETYRDHRMAMAFALIGLRVPGVQISDPGCVSKTFPDFFQVLEQLR